MVDGPPYSAAYAGTAQLRTRAVSTHQQHTVHKYSNHQRTEVSAGCQGTVASRCFLVHCTRVCGQHWDLAILRGRPRRHEPSVSTLDSGKDTWLPPCVTIKRQVTLKIRVLMQESCSKTTIHKTFTPIMALFAPQPLMMIIIIIYS